MRVTRKQTYALMSRLYKVMRTHDDRILLKKLRGMTAYYETPTEEIAIDYRKELIPGLIHEFIHHIHPKWCETKVEEFERCLVNSLSTRQIKNIIRVMAEVL